jgi:hypothetical protein
MKVSSRRRVGLFLAAERTAEAKIWESMGVRAKTHMSQDSKWRELFQLEVAWAGRDDGVEAEKLVLSLGLGLARVGWRVNRQARSEMVRHDTWGYLLLFIADMLRSVITFFLTG